MRPALFMKRPEGRKGREHGIAVVRPAAAVELAVLDERIPRPVALAPADHPRLLVEVAVHQDRAGIFRLTFHFYEKNRRASLEAHHLELHSRQRVLAAPAGGELDRGVDVAVFRPRLVEMRRLGGYADVVDERR